MADISMFMGDQLLLAIDQVLIEENLKEKPRMYVGASGIGGECSRKIWYGLHGEKQKFKAETLRKIADGHSTEAVICSWLRKIPDIELHTHDEDGKQYGFSDLNGKYKGHYDGVIRGIPDAPKTWHVLEVKCVDDKYFNKLQKIIDDVGEKNTLKSWRQEYYAQAVIYMHYTGLKRHLTIVASSGGRRLLTIRTECNNKFAKSLKEKALRIIDSIEPPDRIGGSTYWACKACGFYKTCHA